MEIQNLVHKLDWLCSEFCKALCSISALWVFAAVVQLPSVAAAATPLATKTAPPPPATRLIFPTVSIQSIIDFLSIAEGWLAPRSNEILKAAPFSLLPTVPRLFIIGPATPTPPPL